MEPKISLTGLAKFMTASSSAQRKVLKDYKYREPEGVAQAAYYREGRRTVQGFHRDARDRDWLLTEATALSGQKAGLPDGAQKRLESNVRAIRAYARHFSDRNLAFESPPKLEYAHAGLVINVRPDLWGTERGHRLIKVQFAKPSDPEQTAKVIGQVMLAAATEAGMNLPSSAMRVWDCRKGEDYKLARVGARLQADIEAACETISDLWPAI